MLLTNAGRCATIKVSKDRIYHSLSAVFGHKSQVFWVSWLPADEIDFSGAVKKRAIKKTATTLKRVGKQSFLWYNKFDEKIPTRI